MVSGSACGNIVANGMFGIGAPLFKDLINFRAFKDSTSIISFSHGVPRVFTIMVS